MSTDNTTANKAQDPSKDVVSILVGRGLLTGWKAVRITRGLEQNPPDFMLEMSERFETADAMLVLPGETCAVRIGADTVLTGYVDRVIPTINGRSHSVVVLGRGKTQDLVDCSAEWPGSQITNASIAEIARKLCAPYGIEVETQGDMGPPVTLYPFAATENTWAIIETWCRIRQVIPFETERGTLMLLNGGTTGGASPFKAAASGFEEGVNIERASAGWSMDQRYSEYRCLRMSMDSLRDIGDSLQLIGTFNDPGVPRHRRYAFVAELGHSEGLATAIDRAQWLAARNWGRSGIVQLTTDSWRDKAGSLYQPGTLANIYAPSLRMSEHQPSAAWLITAVSFRYGPDGTHCDITCMPQQAMRPEPTLPPVIIPAEVAAALANRNTP